jgi:serine protease Do
MDALDGVEVADLDSKTRRQANIPNNVQGALVTNVEQDCNAAEAGLRPGDVIMEINRQSVKNSDDAVALSEKATTDHILLRVWSAGTGGGPGGTHYLSVDNTKRK